MPPHSWPTYIIMIEATAYIYQQAGRRWVLPCQLWMSRQPVAEQRCQCQRVFIGRWEVTWRGTCRGFTQCDVIDWAWSAEECGNCWCPVLFYYIVVCLCSCFGNQWMRRHAVAHSSQTNIFRFAEKLCYRPNVHIRCVSSLRVTMAGPTVYRNSH